MQVEELLLRTRRIVAARRSTGSLLPLLACRVAKSNAGVKTVAKTLLNRFGLGLKFELTSSNLKVAAPKKVRECIAVCFAEGSCYSAPVA